jgi:hypothetical protein
MPNQETLAKIAQHITPNGISAVFKQLRVEKPVDANGAPINLHLRRVREYFFGLIAGMPGSKHEDPAVFVQGFNLVLRIVTAADPELVQKIDETPRKMNADTFADNFAASQLRNELGPIHYPRDMRVVEDSADFLINAGFGLLAKAAGDYRPHEREDPLRQFGARIAVITMAELMEFEAVKEPEVLMQVS